MSGLRNLIPAAALALAACAPETDPAEPPLPGPAEAEETPAETRPGLDWQGAAEGAGYSLRLTDLATGEHRLTISCLPPDRLVVHAPSFTPVFSEDRFSFGVGSEPVTLVANPYEQAPGKGVTAEGTVPDDFRALFEDADTVSALYGTQQIGPHVAPPDHLSAPFLRACGA